MYGDSRPASGMEHHLSHFWEMRMYADGKKPALHGHKVGVATIASLAMWKELLKLSPHLENPLSCPPRPEEHEHNIRRLYGSSADKALQTENPELPIEHIKEHWQEIIDIAESLPSPEEISTMLAAAGAPLSPSEIGLDEDTLRDSIIYARDRKKVYTLLQLLGNLDRLEDSANHAVRFFADKALTGVKCFVLDMDGTIYLSEKVFPFSAHFLEYLMTTERDHVFYTNNSSQNTGHYIEKLQRMGIRVPPEKLLMSTHVLLAYLDEHSPGKRAFIAGTKALMADFEAAGYIQTDENPDFTVLGFDTGMDYVRLKKLCGFVRSGLPIYGVNIDYNCPVEGGFIPDCGALAAAVTASTGVTPEFFGKPSRRTLDYIIQKTGYREEELCFVGDRLYTDIAITTGTRARSVLVLSGETKREDLHGTKFVPDLVVNDLSELVMYL
jgi:glycerol-1-phosphate dehydrogenase [NAD(P)+]